MCISTFGGDPVVRTGWWEVARMLVGLSTLVENITQDNGLAKIASQLNNRARTVSIGEVVFHEGGRFW